MTPPDPLRVRPCVEPLEDRNVPSVAEAVQEVQLISELIPAIQANLPALAQVPGIGDILGTVRDTSESNYSELTEFQEEIADALDNQIQSLEQMRAELNQQIADEFNAGVAVADNFVATLPPDQQAAVAGAVAQYKMALGKDAQAKLVRTGDFIGGQEVLSIEYASELNTFLVPIVAQSVDNFVQSDQLAQAVGAALPPDPVSGGGQRSGLITTLGPNYELDIVVPDPRFPDNICSVADYNALVRAGQSVPSVIDRATGQPPPTS